LTVLNERCLKRGQTLFFFFNIYIYRHVHEYVYVYIYYIVFSIYMYNILYCFLGGTFLGKG
jgi:hypothetical protein